jgi:hypothetical protein
VLGAWAQLHSDECPVLAVDFHGANRAVYQGLARRIVGQYRPHLETLEQQYLQLPDGGCALPVAYSLAYGYWMDGRIEEWIAQLEARLADAQLSGDERVNWLLARAQAEEIRSSPPGQHWFSLDRFLAGRGWIEEATLVADSEPVRLRAFQELAARLTVDEHLAAARQILDRAGQRCTGAESPRRWPSGAWVWMPCRRDFRRGAISRKRTRKTRTCRNSARGRRRRWSVATRRPRPIMKRCSPRPARETSDRSMSVSGVCSGGGRNSPAESPRPRPITHNPKSKIQSLKSRIHNRRANPH